MREADVFYVGFALTILFTLTFLCPCGCFLPSFHNRNRMVYSKPCLLVCPEDTVGRHSRPRSRAGICTYRFAPLSVCCRKSCPLNMAEHLRRRALRAHHASRRSSRLRPNCFSALRRRRLWRLKEELAPPDIPSFKVCTSPTMQLPLRWGRTYPRLPLNERQACAQRA